ncbi:MAG: EAL domain-containing protein [Alphaproteobacteria bacterium]|nr:EAL domain-containing protein [Alphaproteobacteria bacterium]
MSKSNALKQQRDRFLAFAFASADLFLEVTPSGTISFTLGAAKGLTGIEDAALSGKNWLELFAPAEQAKLEHLQNETIPGKRRGPLIVHMDENINTRKGIVTAIKMPNAENLYVTLSLSNELMERLATLEEQGFDDSLYNQGQFPKEEGFDDGAYNKNPPPKDETFNDNAYNQSPLPKEEAFDDSLYNQHKYGPEDGFDDSIYNKGEFLDEAEAVFEFARTENKDAEITCFDFGRTQTIPEKDMAAIMDEVAALMRAHAIDGKAAAQIKDGSFTLIHDSGITADQIAEKINSMVKAKIPDSEGLEIKSQTIKADIASTSGEEAARALSYAVDTFEQGGAEKLEVKSLKDGLKNLATSNKEKIKKLKNMIDRAEFDLRFMPVIDLETKEADHYEIVSHFGDEDTKGWIMLAEDTKLIAKLDLAMCERALNHIHFKEGGTPRKFSINISRHALNDRKFADMLLDQLEKRKDLAGRLSIEITDSAHIRNAEKMKQFIQRIRDKGFSVGLDDFDIRPASLELLKALNINYVKLPEKYARRILKSPDTAVLLRNLTKTCAKSRVAVIAKYVENKNQAAVLKEIGIAYGEGHAFSKISTKPAYIS